MNKKFKRNAAISALLIAGLICVDSRYNLKITEHELAFDNLPAAFEGYTVVHLTDFHGDSFGRDNKILADKILKLNPDIIAMTGDMADNMKNIDAFESLLQALEGIAPIYYVSGNHEWGGGCTGEMKALLEKYGGEYLSNEYKPIYREGEKIVLAGVEDPLGRADMIKPDELIDNLRGEYPEDFTLLLGHRNYWVTEYPQLPVELILCGHAHGGIVRLPFIGGLFNVRHGLFADYEKGLYEAEHFVMSVSCGLGNSMPVPRFLNRPEIVSIKLSKS